MPTIYEDTLEAANALLDADEIGGFARRRAVSSACYALFQRLCWLVATCLSRSNIASSDFRRAFRILDHRQCRDQLNRNEEFRAELGAPFARLQDIRQCADYSVLPNPDEAVAVLIFPRSEARGYVEMAANAIGYVDELDLTRQLRIMVALYCARSPMIERNAR